MYFLPAERLRLYRNFKAIEINDFHGIIRYYEQNEDGIRSLDFIEYMDCTLLYAHALYEAEYYGKFLVMCDHLLELSIMQNIQEWEGDDLYHRLLLSKSAALYQQQEYAKSERVLKEVIKIYPYDGLAAVYLNKAMLRQRPLWLFHARGLTVGLALIAVVVIALEIVALPQLFPSLSTPFQIAHNLLIGLSLASLALSEAFHVWRCRRRCVKFVAQARKRRQEA